MNNQARLIAFYLWLRCLQKWRRQKKQTHRKTLVLKVVLICRKKLQNSNLLTPVLPQGSQRTQDLRKHMTNPARLMAHQSRHLNLRRGREKKQTHWKTLVFKVAQTCRKPSPNLNHLIPLCPRGKKRAKAWWKHMTNPARLIAYQSTHLNLRRGREKKQKHRKTLVFKVAQTCRKPSPNLNHLIPLCPRGKRRAQAWWKNMTD